MNPVNFGEVESVDLSTPERAKRVWNLANRKIITLTLKNKALNQKNRRLMKKLTSLQELVNRLKRNNSAVYSTN